MDPVTLNLLILIVWFSSTLYAIWWGCARSVLDRETLIGLTLVGPFFFLVVAWPSLDSVLAPFWRRLKRRFRALKDRVADAVWPL